MGNGELAIGPKLPRPSSTLPVPEFFGSESGSYQRDMLRTQHMDGRPALTLVNPSLGKES